MPFPTIISLPAGVVKPSSVAQKMINSLHGLVERLIYIVTLIRKTFKMQECVVLRLLCTKFTVAFGSVEALPVEAV